MQGMGVDMDKRYGAFGGIAALAQRYEQDIGLTMSEIGAAVGYTRQTVYNDLLRFLGRVPRKPVKSTAPSTFTHPREFLHCLASARGSFPPDVEERLVRAFTDFRAERIEIAFGGKFAVMHGDSRKAQVRFLPEGTQDKFTRVKITAEAISAFETLYFIIVGADARCFRYPARPLARLKTLAIPNVQGDLRHGGCLLT